MATVINPAVPYKTELTSNRPGTLIHVKGTVNAEAGRFAINLRTDSDTAFHFNPRFGDDNTLVMNTKKDGSWGPEERSCCSLERGAAFDLTILFESEKFMVGLNGNHYCHFDYRLKRKDIKKVEIVGDVEISLFQETTAFSSSPIVNPPVPYTAYIPGGFTAGKMLLAYGVASGETFSINLQCGHEPFKNIGLHFNPRVSQGQIVLNDLTEGNWGGEQRCSLALHQDWAFAVEIVCHDDAFDVRVNGTELAHFEHRNTHARSLQMLDTIHICGDVQIHLLRI